MAVGRTSEHVYDTDANAEIHRDADGPDTVSAKSLAHRAVHPIKR
jgi:hypothetical protein